MTRPGARALWLLLILASLGSPVPAEAQFSDLRGRVLDREKGEGVPDATVLLEGSDTTFTALTDSRGLFDVRQMPSGAYRVTVQHLAYGEHVQTVTLADDALVALRILISRQAIELDPVVIEAMSQEELRNRSRGTMIQEVKRPEIERAARTSHHLGDILRQTVPGLRVYDSQYSPGARVCIEFRGRRSIRFANACQSPLLILDGVRMFDPPSLYNTIQPNSIQRIEVIPPAEAGLLYGSDSAFGVLVIETKVWLTEEEKEALPVHLRGGVYDWSLEVGHHSWKKVLLASAVGNAVGVAVGLTLADRCIRYEELATDIFATDCNRWATAGAWGAALSFPLLGAAAGARIAGGTPLSQGRFLPAVVSGAIAMIPGYALAAAAQQDTNAPSFRVGQAMVLVGIPLAVTVADRIFRKIRGR